MIRGELIARIFHRVTESPSGFRWNHAMDYWAPCNGNTYPTVMGRDVGERDETFGGFLIWRFVGGFQGASGVAGATSCAFLIRRA